MEEVATKKRFIRLRDRTKENDIKFGGFISYRHLRIAAWLCLVIAQIGLSFKITATMNPDIAEPYSVTSQILSNFSSLPLPLFMLANFSIILRGRNNFRYLIIFYSGIAALMYLLGIFVCSHYGYGVIKIFKPDLSFGSATLVFGNYLLSLGNTGYIFNLFIDLLLCVLSFYFLTYHPKKYFQGKKIILFRSFLLIPIAYEAGSMLLKYYCGVEQNNISFFLFFLLTSKPPLIFLSFIAIIIILKIKEVAYKKKYQNERNYSDFIETNAHTFSTGIIMAIVFFAISIIDFLIVFIVVIAKCKELGDFSELTMLLAYTPLQKMGLGDSIGLILLVPIALLFNYRKVYKPSKIDLLIPVIGIGAVLITTIEGIFSAVTFSLGRMDNMPETDPLYDGMIHITKTIHEGIRSFLNR